MHRRTGQWKEWRSFRSIPPDAYPPESQRIEVQATSDLSDFCPTRNSITDVFEAALCCPKPLHFHFKLAEIHPMVYPSQRAQGSRKRHSGNIQRDATPYGKTAAHPHGSPFSTLHEGSLLMVGRMTSRATVTNSRHDAGVDRRSSAQPRVRNISG